MMKIFSYLHTVLLFPATRLIVTYQSERNRIKTLFKKPRTLFEGKYNGEKVILLALYQKGKLRPDVERFAKACKDAGHYVMGVNTLRLSNPDQYREILDCYIERPNFGRDFGSYKTGFLHFFKNSHFDSCERLMMVNDSVFFTNERTPKFISDMMNSNIEVLGSTENFDIEYHLGSFCISISRKVFQKEKFKNYWKGYILSDLRPAVIKRGEMMLSKTLKSCASSPSQFTALYSGVNYLEILTVDDEMIDFSFENSRRSKINPWKTASIKDVAKNLVEKYFARESDLSDTANTNKRSVMMYGQQEKIEKIQDELKFLGDIRSLSRFISEIGALDHFDERKLKSALIQECASSFFTGSHIHQSPVILLKMGLPIIKNDGVYRGLLSFEDILKLSQLLDSEESKEMQDLLLSRPFGGNHLEGWKRAAFNLGYL